MLVGNKHPADLLSEVRSKIRELKDQEQELRLLLLELPEVERRGLRYEAYITDVSYRRLDADKLAAVLGDLTPYYRASSHVAVKLRVIRYQNPPTK